MTSASTCSSPITGRTSSLNRSGAGGRSTIAYGCQASTWRVSEHTSDSDGKRSLRPATRRLERHRDRAGARRRFQCGGHHRHRRPPARRRGQADPPFPAAAGGKIARLPRARHGAAGRRGGDGAYRNPGARRHYRWSRHPPGQALRQHHLGQLKMRAGRRLALHAGLSHRPRGAQLQGARPADRSDPADGRGRVCPDGKAGHGWWAKPNTTT